MLTPVSNKCQPLVINVSGLWHQPWLVQDTLMLLFVLNMSPASPLCLPYCWLFTSQLVAVPQPYASAPKGNQLSILQPGWPCTSLGSAAKMEATVMALARKRKAVSQGQQEAETQ
jgi:hypothetical protein